MAETIAAISTARGQAGVAVIRVSGPDAWAVGEQLAGRLGPSGRLVLRTLRDPVDDVVLDSALVVNFAEGHSFTGENIVEFHIHGGIAVQRAVLRAVSGLAGVRLAEPGEFTRRALLNGRMDLTQVEGLSDLIAAETEAQRRQAVVVMSGALGQAARGWRETLVRVAALLAAAIDFADEDIPEDVLAPAGTDLAVIRADLARQLAGAAAAERVREGFEVAIVGRPNVGKSTLLNRLAGREAALTSEVAGTTRDVIEVRMEINGLAVTLLDTAGLRSTEDQVEAAGVARARERAVAADLRVFLLEPEENPDPALWQPDDMAVTGKADLYGGEGVSGTTGAGIGRLLEHIGSVLELRTAGSALVTRERHRLAMAAAGGALDSALEHLASEDLDLAAEELARAIRSLDVLIGSVGVEDLLDDIFARFCVGK